jgi:hypothetical protein
VITLSLHVGRYFATWTVGTMDSDEIEDESAEEPVVEENSSTKLDGELDLEADHEVGEPVRAPVGFIRLPTDTPQWWGNLPSNTSR